jgi:hypothetical protein
MELHGWSLTFMPKRKTDRKLLELLKREFPLMSSRRLPFMTAEMVIRVFNGELPECEGLHKSVKDYVKWMDSGYDPDLDPAKKYE